MSSASRTSQSKIIALPAPRLRSRFSVEKALFIRRSLREYTKDPVTLADLSQLLWSAQGITSPEGFRTTPSAGAVFPLEIYACVARGDGIAPGVYHYVPGPGINEHRLELMQRGSVGTKLFELSTRQDFIKQVPLNLVLAAHHAKMDEKYPGGGAPRYVFMEIGHAAQNIHLQAVALGLDSVAVGYLNEPEVRALLGIEAEPQYMVSVGNAKK